jgi:protein-S-isoprenylcysteine O-methyltransferase Ste14
MARAIAQTIGAFAIQAALLFGTARRFDWPMAWALLATLAVVAIAGFLVLDPDLIRERAKPASGFDPIDALIATPATLLLVFAPLPVAGLDAGRTQASSFPLAVQVAALGAYALGNAFATWAARTNRFFADFVRVQTERGHHVVDRGPYAFVRHPGYAGGILGYGAVPFALGSAWALVPALAGALLLCVRARREERTLRAGLPGYEAYAGRVRWRILPGVF